MKGLQLLLKLNTGDLSEPTNLASFICSPNQRVKFKTWEVGTMGRVEYSEIVREPGEWADGREATVAVPAISGSAVTCTFYYLKMFRYFRYRRSPCYAENGMWPVLLYAGISLYRYVWARGTRTCWTGHKRGFPAVLVSGHPAGHVDQCVYMVSRNCISVHREYLLVSEKRW